MTKEDFKLVVDSWQKIADEVHNRLDHILSVDDLLNLKVNELQELVQYCDKFINDMEFMFCDFRHLIGMAGLSAVDRNKLTSIFKDVTSFRSDAKRIKSISSITNIGYIPVPSEYKLKLTPSIKLVSQLRPGQKHVDPSKIQSAAETAEISSKVAEAVQHMEFRKTGEHNIQMIVSREDLSYARFLLSVSSVTEKIDLEKGEDRFINKVNQGKVYGLNVTSKDGKCTFNIQYSNEKANMFNYFSKLVSQINQD